MAYTSIPHPFSSQGQERFLLCKHSLEETAGQGGNGGESNPQCSEIKLLISKATVLGCLTFAVRNDVCAEFNTRRVLSHSSAEGGSFSVLALNSV